MSHDERHDLSVWKHAFQKRQLHLERMLAHVRRRMRSDLPRSDRDGICAVLGDGHGPERRLEGTALVNRDAIESDVVRRAHEHRHLDIASAKQTVGMRRDRPRIHEARMRRDNRDWIARRWFAGGLEVTVYFPCERFGLRRIPRSCDRGAANGDHTAW